MSAAHLCRRHISLLLLDHPDNLRLGKTALRSTGVATSSLELHNFKLYERTTTTESNAPIAVDLVERNSVTNDHSPDDSPIRPDSDLLEKPFGGASPDGFRIIGIGASAGGLSALEAFFENCPNDSGAAFVVIQHLSPTHESLMADLLGRRTEMPVTMIDSDCRIEPNHVYLIPPGAIMRVDNGYLRLAPRNEILSLPIDIFFSSLAASHGRNAIGIVLSGTGSDGTRGASEINLAGGLVLIQEPAEAKFDGMPMSALRAGIVDAVLPVSQLAIRALQHPTPPRIRAAPDQNSKEYDGPAENSGRIGSQSAALDRIFQTLKDASGIDFRAYKSTTILRRMSRRMQVQQIGSLNSYFDLLSSSPDELATLQRELLISVTRFFRDEEAFRALSDRAIPRIVESLGSDDTVRVWVPGCATGEEAYSIAILLHEACDRVKRRPQLKIFATDVNQTNLQVASAGTYPGSIVTEVGSERLERFFRPVGDFVTVASELRQGLVFARHDLLCDPPFTRMDLVSCRNTLIYLRKEAQETVLRRLQYAVRDGGFLFLGSSETLMGVQDGLEATDSKNKLFRRVRAGYPLLLDLQAANPVTRGRKQEKSGSAAQPLGIPRAATGRGGGHSNDKTTLADVAMRALLDAWAPPSILVDHGLEAVHFEGDLQPYLRTRSGRASLDLTRLLPEPLTALASVLVREAIDSGCKNVSEPVEIQNDGVQFHLRLHATPISHGSSRTFALLSFERLGAEDGSVPLPKQTQLADVAKARIDILQQELEITRADLQNTIEELETSNQELQATNEELMASNEELQSSNEELQSVNEEINTVNAEYQEKMAQLNRLNADLSSMIRAVGVATIFLDEALLITRFSPDAASIFKLRDSDLGRPLGDITHKLTYPSLLNDIRETLRSQEACEREVMAEDGELFRLRIMSYAVGNSGHRGVVITLMNVTVYRDLERLQGILDALPEHVAVLGSDGTIVMTNNAWRRFARANGDPQLTGCGAGVNYLDTCLMTSGGNHPNDASEDRRIAKQAYQGVKAILEGSRSSFSLEYPCHSPDEQRWFFMSAAPVAGQEFGAIVSHIDITPWYTRRAR